MSDSEPRLQGPLRTIDVNADLGEGCPNDRALLERVSSASVCCGAHAGDPATSRETLRAARDLGTTIGAHPGFPDREGFGRRERTITTSEVERLILDQTDALRGLAEQEGMLIRYLKPHGALYNQAQRQYEVAKGILLAAARLELPVLGQPGTLLEAAAQDLGVWFVAEGFPDRRYLAGGSLAPRNEPDAVLHDPALIEAQVIRLLEEGRVATLCVHGDEPTAVANADHILLVLSRHGIAIRNFLA
jgi:UPF0271 protein